MTSYNQAGLAAVLKYAAQSGDPITFIATALVESGLNPGAVGDNGHSFGLFQLNDRGRLASYHLTPAQAKDPDTNARVSALDFAMVYGTGKRGVELAFAAQRPSDPYYRAKIRNAIPQAQQLWAHRSNPFDFGASATPGLIANAISNPLAGATYTQIGGPGQGTHNTRQNWQSDAAVDLAVSVGTPVYAPISGTIFNAGPLGSSDPRLAGIRVTIQGTGLFSGFVVYLAHLSGLAAGIAPGATVHAGQVIGRSGSARGVPHLHFAVGSNTNGAESNGTPGRISLLLPVKDLGGGKFQGKRGGGSTPIGDALGAGAGAVGGAISAAAGAAKDAAGFLFGLPGGLAGKVAGAILKWVETHALTALAYVVGASLGVYLLARGSNQAFGTPTLGEVTRSLPVPVPV